MKIIFCIILVAFCTFCVFYFLWAYEALVPQKQIATTQAEPPTINSTWWICIRDPNIQFFMYHYIRDHDHRDNATIKELSIAPNLFEKHMQEIEALAKKGLITLMHGDAFIKSQQSWCFPGKKIWIFTADDGWIDMKDSLIPIATIHRVPFFLGIITDKLDIPWFVTKDDIIDFSKNPLISLASHSLGHRDNSKLAESDLKREMCESRKILQKITQQSVDAYIYPSGRMNPALSEKVSKECGYTLAWSTRYGSDYNSATRSLYEINRIRISSDTEASFFDHLLSKIDKKLNLSE